MAAMSTAAFDQLKRESLRKLRDLEDKSPKGSVDAPIVDMIRMINDHHNYVTSSSCSGRIAVFRGVPASATAESDHLITKGGAWLLAEHDTVTIEQLQSALRGAAGDQAIASNMVLFKHEPFIMHVVCRDVDAAKELLQVGLACGFRESGIVVGNRKIMCAIRTTANAMEIPLGCDVGNLLVSDEYLQWIVDVANEKFIANRKKTDQLWAAFRKAFTETKVTTLLPVGMLKRSPSTVSLRRCRPMTTPLLQRVGHTSVLYGTSVYVFGGQGQSAAGTSSRLADIIQVTGDEVNHSVSVHGAVPAPRMHHSAVVVGDEMFVFGGRAGPLTCFNDVFAFHFATQTWRQVIVGGEQQPAPRWKHSSSVVGSTMFVYGGRDASSVFGDLFAINLAAPEPVWHQIDFEGVAPSPRFDHVGVALPHTQQLLVWGGLASLDEATSADVGHGEACWLLDIATKTWHLQSIKNAEQGPAAGLFGTAPCTVDGGAHVILCGGIVASSSTETTTSSSQNIYSLSVATLEWQLLGAIDSATSEHRAALVYSSSVWLPASSELLVLGGGFQVFGFGQCYSSSFACELVVVSKDGGAATTASVSAALPSASAAVIQPTVPSVIDLAKPLGVLTEKANVKAAKTLLEAAGVYDKTRRVHVVPDRQLTHGPAFLLPVIAAFASACTSDAALQAFELVVDEDAYLNKFGKATGSNRNDVVRLTVESFAKRHGVALELIPDKYEFVSDVLLVPRGSFTEAAWSPFAREMWAAVCGATTPKLSRVARKAFIDPGEKRQSHVELLYVDAASIQSSRPLAHGWVEVRENGITYGWDLTKVMFSSGNVTEKARMGAIGCAGEVIVDLFCGIGYYVVPFLVHGGAAFVHACEWNPDSVDALRFNLQRNHVAHKCRVYEGDNQLHAPTIGAVADRVNLGLLPTSEKAWPLAAQVMKKEGGWMHVHDNVAVEDREAWQQRVVESMRALGERCGKRWRVTCEHVEKVKSYAPKVHHLVADIKCVAIDSE